MNEHFTTPAVVLVVDDETLIRLLATDVLEEAGFEVALMYLPLLRFSTDATMLAIEAQSVISARLTQFAMGLGTSAETNLMVSEKIFALAEAVATVAAGGSVHEVVRGYRKHVRANLRRLSN